MLKINEKSLENIEFLLRFQVHSDIELVSNFG